MYEHKQYKKGLKATETILKKTLHPESLAMKGLFLHHLNRKDEAYVCIKQAVAAQITSSICWHVYGIIWKTDRNYMEASKCYGQAKRLDKENYQILRDWGLIQMQLRNTEGYLDARRQMLDMKADQRANFIGLAVAYAFNDQPESAVRVLDAHLNMVEKKEDLEIKEIFMYRNQLLRLYEEKKAVLADLDKLEAMKCDPQWILEQRAEIVSESGDTEEALKLYERLFDRMPSNKQFFDEIMKCLKIEVGSSAYMQKIEEYKSKHPRSQFLRVLPLSLVDNKDAFETQIAEYLKNGMRRGNFSF